MGDEALKFDYDKAFYINSGLFSAAEQEKIRNARVTIVGVGGAGGVIAITLARSGVGNFMLVDYDVYSLSNINRQVCCFVDTIGKYKAEVVKAEILRINPEANVTALNRKISFDELAALLDETDVYVSAADDLAYSAYSMRLAQDKGVYSITFMPGGLAGYILAIPPGLPHKVDPTHLFGGPRGLSYEDLRNFLANPEYRSGERWYISQGKMRIEWFRKWCAGERTLTQLCPSIWAGGSLASVEIVKYITGKWKRIVPPKMWQLELGDNRIRVAGFRRRTWLFNKFIYRAFNIKFLGIGGMIRRRTLEGLEKDLARMEKEESEGREPRLPFMWRYII